MNAGVAFFLNTRNSSSATKQLAFHPRRSRKNLNYIPIGIEPKGRTQDTSQSQEELKKVFFRVKGWALSSVKPYVLATRSGAIDLSTLRDFESFHAD